MYVSGMGVTTIISSSNRVVATLSIDSCVTSGQNGMITAGVYDPATQDMWLSSGTGGVNIPVVNSNNQVVKTITMSEAGLSDLYACTPVIYDPATSNVVCTSYGWGYIALNSTGYYQGIWIINGCNSFYFLNGLVYDPVNQTVYFGMNACGSEAVWGVWSPPSTGFSPIDIPNYAGPALFDPASNSLYFSNNQEAGEITVIS